MSITESIGSNEPGEDGNTNTSPSYARYWFFTCNNYSDKNIKEILYSEDIKLYAFQEEVGESGTPHLQGCLEFHKRLRPRYLFDKRFHWELARNWHAAVEYCTLATKRKPDGNMWTNIIWASAQWQVIHELKHWQSKLWEMVKAEDNDRFIWWVWDSKGNTGKSALCKWLCIKHGAIVLSGKAADMKHGIAKSKAKPSLVLLDIPRESYDYVSYTGIEEIKNGCFFSSKFDGGMVLMNSPTVICFANSPPEKDSMSIDRWRVFQVSDF